MNPDISKSNVDRRTIPLDDKQRILDLTTYKFQPPSVGIFDAPTRCYSANVEWAKIIEGHLDWLTEIAAWKEAENETYIGIQEMLKFLEGTDCDMTDLTEILERLDAIEDKLMTMQEDICAGMICAIEEASRRILLAANKDNVLSDISIGKDDNTITIVNPPAQPPGAIEASSLEVANGYTYAVGMGILGFFSELNTGYLDALDTAEMSLILRSIYDLNVPDDVVFQGAIADYWAAWNTGGQSYIPNAGKVSEFIWLYGANKKSLARYALYVAKEISNPVGSEVFAMVDFITSEQIAIWYAQGEGQPRSDYVTYPDYRNDPSSVFNVTPADLFTGSASRTFSNIWLTAIPKLQGNRWMIKASGLITNNVLNRTIDAMYEFTGVTYQYNQVTGLNSGGGDVSPESQPVRREDHNYNIYYTNSYAGSNTISGFRYFNNLPLWSAGDCTGLITFQIFDLGKD